MTEADLTRMRFAFSPLSEVVHSLFMLHSGQIPAHYRGWAEFAASRLQAVDWDLLRAVVPSAHAVLGVPLGTSTETTVEKQLEKLAGLPSRALRRELVAVYENEDLPPAVQQILADPQGTRRVAAALWDYWDAAIRPFWSRVEAVLNSEIAYRARQLASGGIALMLSDLHPQLEVADHLIRMDRWPGRTEYDLAGDGLLLIPCVFTWPLIRFDRGSLGPPHFFYGPRGVAALWEQDTRPAAPDPLAALIGRARAAVLRRTSLPVTTTDLAKELNLSAASASEHLTTLRQCGMVASWRTGRRVLYQQTELAASMITAAGRAHS